MTTTCGCGQPAPSAFLCSRCERQLRRTLLEVPALATELDTVLARNTAYAEHHGGRSADKPLPIDTRASEAAWVLRNTLTTWRRVLWEDRGLEMPTTATETRPESTRNPSGYPRQGQTIPTAQIAAWLADHIHDLAQHPAASEAHDDITAACANARRTIDTPPNRAIIPVGPCPEPDCGGTVRAYIPHDQPAHMTCTAPAHHRWEAHQWARAGMRILKARQEATT